MASCPLPQKIKREQAYREWYVSANVPADIRHNSPTCVRVCVCVRRCALALRSLSRLFVSRTTLRPHPFSRLGRPSREVVPTRRKGAKDASNSLACSNEATTNNNTGAAAEPAKRLMKPWTTIHLFTPSEVTAAFDALRTHAPALYSTAPNNPLSSFARHRRGASTHHRDHLEMPVHHALRNSSMYQQLPPEVRHICAGLHAAALESLQEALRESCIRPSARVDVQRDLERKSVLRILRYPVDCGCRPHVDPGLCTALLGGSDGGLEVNTDDAVPPAFTDRPGDFTPRKGEGGEEENALASLPHWTPVRTAHAGEAVWMPGNMLDVVSDGQMPGVLHRVRRDWYTRRLQTGDLAGNVGATELWVPSFNGSVDRTAGNTARRSGDQDDYRFNVIVELRPAEPKRWYATVQETPSCKVLEGRQGVRGERTVA